MAWSYNQFQAAFRTVLPSQEDPVSLGAEAKSEQQIVLPKLGRIWNWVQGRDSWPQERTEALGGQVQHSSETCEASDGSRKSTQGRNQTSLLLPAASPAAGTYGHFLHPGDSRKRFLWKLALGTVHIMSTCFCPRTYHSRSTKHLCQRSYRSSVSLQVQ